MTRDAPISQGLLQRFFRRLDPVPLGNSRATFLSIFHIRDHIAFSFVLLKLIDNDIDDKKNHLHSELDNFYFSDPHSSHIPKNGNKGRIIA